MITLLIGLPGSGKTWYAQNVLEYDVFIDDPKDLSDFPRDINSSQHIVIADPMLCVGLDRAVSFLMEVYSEHSIEYIFFENNPEKCQRNVEYRIENGDIRKVNITADILVKQYSIPNDVKIIPIWSPKNEKNDES